MHCVNILLNPSSKKDVIQLVNTTLAATQNYVKRNLSLEKEMSTARRNFSRKSVKQIPQYQTIHDSVFAYLLTSRYNFQSLFSPTPCLVFPEIIASSQGT